MKWISAEGNKGNINLEIRHSCTILTYQVDEKKQQIKFNENDHKKMHHSWRTHIF